MSGVTDERLRVLYATTEVYPLAKTDGLADVGGVLPSALCPLYRDFNWIINAARCLERCRVLLVVDSSRRSLS
ncbi:MAG TPA: glycogen/starch synthase [Xanthomonadaceae bacterium]|nr:glycogen/starch synthase [Xanthomonadaceae bacterium]